MANTDNGVELPPLPSIAEIEEVAQGFHDPEIFSDTAVFSVRCCKLLSKCPTVMEKIKAYGKLAEMGPPFTNGFMLGYLTAINNIEEKEDGSRE